MNTATFSRRIYTVPSLTADVKLIFDNMAALRNANHSGHVSHAFAEKIMLVVTSVNGCRYCSYGHSRAALAAGVPEIELRKLLSLELGEFPTSEVVALTFAQYYAESRSNPDPAAWRRLSSYYGEETANDIVTYIRMITFGNLLGNTFDALLSRFAGKPAPGSSIWNELGVLLGAIWMPPMRLLLQLFKKENH
jgi:AhpD family alkylhydroperoxidase